MARMWQPINWVLVDCSQNLRVGTARGPRCWPMCRAVSGRVRAETARRKVLARIVCIPWGLRGVWLHPAHSWARILPRPVLVSLTIPDNIGEPRRTRTYNPLLREAGSCLYTRRRRATFPGTTGNCSCEDGTNFHTHRPTELHGWLHCVVSQSILGWAKNLGSQPTAVSQISAWRRRYRRSPWRAHALGVRRRCC
jgi:hypothetical protein